MAPFPHHPSTLTITPSHLHPKNHRTFTLGSHSPNLPSLMNLMVKLCFRASIIPSSPTARPPPEPPPPPPISSVTFTEASPPADLTTPRPDPKPPWLLSCVSAPPPIWLCFKGCILKSDGVHFLSFYGLCFYVFSQMVVSCYVLWCLVVVLLYFASKVFVERSLFCWLSWKCFLHSDSHRTETWAIISNLFYPFYRQASIVILESLDHRETTNSRNAHILAKEMIRNWIDSKTVDSPSWLAIYHM